MSAEKDRVHDYWNEASCGEDLLLQSTDRAGYEAYSVAQARELFSAFSDVKIRTVLIHGDPLDSRARPVHAHRGAEELIYNHVVVLV